MVLCCEQQGGARKGQEKPSQNVREEDATLTAIALIPLHRTRSAVEAVEAAEKTQQWKIIAKLITRLFRMVRD